MVGAAQQVQQGFVVVFARGLERGQAQRQLALEVGGNEAVVEDGIAGELVDHTGVLQQIARGPARRAQQVQQALMHRRTLQQQRQIAFAPQQRLQPVDQAHAGFFAHAAVGHPLRGALHQAEQARAGFVAQAGDARVVTPFGDARRQPRRQLGNQVIDLLRRGHGERARTVAIAGTALRRRIAAEQGVEFLGHKFAVGVELVQEAAAVGVAHGLGNPQQVVVARGQHMRLLVVEVLDAVLDLAQEGVGLGQRLGGLGRHQPGARQALQGFERGPAAQLGELPAAHDLQQLHGEFDFAYAAARQLDVVGAPRVAGAALGRMLADLAVQRAQRVEHAVVEIAAEHERQDHAAQRLDFGRAQGVARCDHATLEPGKAFPFAALRLQVFLERGQRHRRRAGIAIGPQRQIDAEHKAMLGHFADQRIDALDRAGEIFMVGNAAPAIGLARGLAFVFVDVDQVDVAGDIELACTELAHAHDPQRHHLALGAHGRAMAAVEFRAHLVAGPVQRHLGKLGHGLRHHGQRGLLGAVQLHQALHHQLAQHAQRARQLHALVQQGLQRLLHACALRHTLGEKPEFGRVAPV